MACSQYWGQQSHDDFIFMTVHYLHLTLNIFDYNLSLSSSFGKPVAPPTIPNTCQAPPECDIITTLLDDCLASPPGVNETSAQDEKVTNTSSPPPPPPLDSTREMVAPPPPPPPLPQPPSVDTLTNHICSPLAPPLILETGTVFLKAKKIISIAYCDITMTSHLFCPLSGGGE